MNKKIALTGVLFIVLSIILGAFGAHGLKNLVNAEKLVSFETGVKYQMYSGLALLVLGLSNNNVSPSKLFFTLNILGVILFSFSIYLLCLHDFIPIPKMLLVPLTPVGGLMMIASWGILFFNLLRLKN
jgi:uncharacterized membrane protein YgdD (TMEM256/DUF423 family)